MKMTLITPVLFLAVACSKSAPAPMEECSGNSMCRGQLVQVCCTGGEACVVRTAGQADRDCMGAATACTQVLTDLLTSCEMTMADAGMVTHDDAMEVDLGQETPDAGEAPDVDMTPDAMDSPDVDMTPDAMDMTPDAGMMTPCERLLAACSTLPSADQPGCEEIARRFAAEPARYNGFCGSWLNTLNRVTTAPDDRAMNCTLSAVGTACQASSQCCSGLCNPGVPACFCYSAGNANDSLTWNSCEKQDECCESFVCRVREGTSVNLATRYCSPM